ncbi:MAG: GNAT family N-acetyltransferase [Eubacterium sp.]
MIDYTIEKIGLDEYNKSNSVWDMKNCSFTEQFKEQIACGNRDAYLMKYKDKYIASCDLVYDYGEYTKENAKVYLSRLIVKKEYRNKGIGQKLLKYMIALCKEKGYQQITVGVDTDNKNAIHIYKKFGFKIYETTTDEYGKFYKMILTFDKL